MHNLSEVTLALKRSNVGESCLHGLHQTTKHLGNYAELQQYVKYFQFVEPTLLWYSRRFVWVAIQITVGRELVR